MKLGRRSFLKAVGVALLAPALPKWAGVKRKALAPVVSQVLTSVAAATPDKWAISYSADGGTTWTEIQEPGEPEIVEFPSGPRVHGDWLLEDEQEEEEIE